MDLSCASCGQVNPAGTLACYRCGQALPPNQGAGFGAPSYPPPSYPPQAPSYPPQAPSYPPQPPASSGFGAPQSSYPPGQPQNQPWTPGQMNPPASSWQTPAFPGAAMMPMESSEQKSAKTMAVIGMIVSFVALFMGWCCYSGFILGPIAVVLGFISKSKLNSINSRDGMGMAYAAIGIGLFATLIPLIFIVFVLIVGALSP